MPFGGSVAVLPQWPPQAGSGSIMTTVLSSIVGRLREPTQQVRDVPTSAFGERRPAVRGREETGEPNEAASVSMLGEGLRRCKETMGSVGRNER